MASTRFTPGATANSTRRSHRTEIPRRVRHTLHCVIVEAEHMMRRLERRVYAGVPIESVAGRRRRCHLMRLERLMNKTLTACVLAIGVSVIGVDRAWAQTQTFMLVPGIAGGSVDARHSNWIDVLSITQTLESNGKRGSSCELQVAKSFDIAGPPLWAAAVTGQVFPEIRVEVVKLGEDRVLLYEIKLGNARVSTISTSVAGAFAETLALVADTATLSVFPQKPDGSTGPPVSATVSCK
jgi:type VI protein secretion system component Hcp